MNLNSCNFVSASKEVAVGLALLLSFYQQIEVDNESTHDHIEMLDGQFGEILERMHEVIEYAGQARETADMISESLSSGLKLTSQIMSEKTRIIKTCPALTDPFYKQDGFSLN